MIEQLNIFGESEFVHAQAKEDYDPMTDMAFQPPNCQDCGAPYRRNGAYLHCTKNPDKHWRFVDCPSREEHPHFEAFVRYRRQIGHPID